MPPEIELTSAEHIAKEHFLLHFREGSLEPCDVDIEEPELPPWYDEAKYKRGQKYFQDNRLAILNSNLTGLICLLAEPRGLKILSSTGRSSSKETARKRYLSTILHTLSWYEVDLAPGSRSRKSISVVRKMHFLASKSMEEKNIGAIKQSELALTAFGFMGFALIRPHVIGVRYDNAEDREAFVHLWACLCYMIGVKDKFNICLLPMDALQVLCEMFLRYMLIPIIQVELPLFKTMTVAMIDGMRTFLPHLDYDSQLFTAKMVCGVPGYQYGIDCNKEKLCRSILTQKEVDECNEIVRKYVGDEHIPLSVNIPVIEITKLDDVNRNNNIDNGLNLIEVQIHQAMELSPNDQLTIKYINYEEDWQSCLNDSKFYKLNAKSRGIIKSSYWSRKLYDYSILRYLIESLTSFVLNRMKGS